MDPSEVSLQPQVLLADHGIPQAEFDATQLEWDSLREIARDHTSSLPSLQSAANYISQRLQTVNGIHSLKVRVKNYRHLIAKVIRKKIDRPELHFDSKSYRNLVTDLIGLRALHLFKDEWLPIHNFVVDTWELHEQPKAYIRAGDPEPLLQGFRDANCEVSIHPFGYRSIHYLLKFKPDKHTYIAELQVRTIFEEGWSEIDHRVRYPRQSDDAYLADFLAIFNRLAGSADEMGSFIKTLVVFTASQAKKIAELNTNVLEKEAALEKAISELTINETEKDKFKKIISDLRESSQSTQNQAYLSTIAPTLSLSNFVTVQPTNFDFLKTQPLTSPSSLIGGLSSPSYTVGKTEKKCFKCNSAFLDDAFGASTHSVLWECPECRGLSLGITKNLR